MPTDTRPTSYPFPYLIDAPEDGGVEAHAWVAGDLAATPGDAIIVFEKSYLSDNGEHPLGDRWPDETIVCTGKEWNRPYIVKQTIENMATGRCVCEHRPLIHIDGVCSFGGCSCTAYREQRIDKHLEVEIFGAAAIAAAGDALSEDLRFRECEPDDEGAQEWWLLEIVAACTKIVQTQSGDAFWCTGPAGHDGGCIYDTATVPVREHLEAACIEEHDWRLAEKVRELARAGGRIASVTYAFPAVSFATGHDQHGELFPAYHRERLRQTNYRRPPRAIVQVSFRPETIQHDATTHGTVPTSTVPAA